MILYIQLSVPKGHKDACPDSTSTGSVRSECMSACPLNKNENQDQTFTQITKHNKTWVLSKLTPCRSYILCNLTWPVARAPWSTQRRYSWQQHLRFAAEYPACRRQPGGPVERRNHLWLSILLGDHHDSNTQTWTLSVSLYLCSMESCSLTKPSLISRPSNRDAELYTYPWIHTHMHTHIKDNRWKRNERLPSNNIC